MRAGVKRVLDYFAYAVSGVALAGAALYGIQRQRAPDAAAVMTPIASPAAVPAAKAATTSSALGAPVSGAVEPPGARRDAAIDEPATTPAANRSQASRGESGTAPPPTALAPTAQDRATFYALQRNCYDAAANNQSGEYPALQASACNRYAQFANERGLDTGSLPAYGQAQASPVSAEQPASPQNYANTPSPVVVSEPQVIILQQDIDRDRHRWHDRPAGNIVQPQQQIGPNYPLPRPQQPPPVSQEQRREQRNKMVPAPGPQN